GTVHSLTDCFRITSKLRNNLLNAPRVSLHHSYLILLVIPYTHCGIFAPIRIAARSARPGPPLGPPRNSWCPSNGPGQSIFCGRSVFLAGGQTRRFTPEWKRPAARSYEARASSRAVRSDYSWTAWDQSLSAPRDKLRGTGLGAA